VTDLKGANDIVSIDDIVSSLKQKYNEYARTNAKHLERQSQQIIDAHFADLNGTNIRK